jgi:hypothetical protein
MRKHVSENANNIVPVLMDRTTFYKYVGSGRATGDAIAKAANAERRFGARVMIYRPAIDNYLAAIGEDRRAAE